MLKKKIINKLPAKKRFIIVTIVLLICTLGPFLLSEGQAQTTAPETHTEGESFWLWNFLGHLHPIAVHFPVGLILFSAILELFTLKNFNSKLRPGINLLVIAGVVSAIVSAIMGLLLARGGDYAKNILALHQWTGIATAVLGTVAALFLVSIKKNKQLSSIRAYRGILFFTGIGVSVAGHFGGSLTHGSDYLSSAVPWSNDYKPLTLYSVDFASFKNDTGKLTSQQELELNMQVKTILAHNCYKCHGSDKIKGDLRLDRKDMAFKGGEDGPVIIPGKPMESEIVKRITLPANDKKAMPSKDKRLSEDEVELIKLWIKKGGALARDFRKGSALPGGTVAAKKPGIACGIRQSSKPC